MKFFGYEVNDNTSIRPLELRESTIVTSSIEEIDTLIEFLQFVKHSHLRTQMQYNNSMNTHTHFSMWVEDYGMPNDLIIITDTTKNENRDCEDASGYSELVNSKEYHKLCDLDKLKEMCRYFDKIKNNDFINMHFARELFYRIKIPEKEKKEFIFEACKRILSYSRSDEYRRDALLIIGNTATDEELEEITKFNVTDAEYNEMVEHRAFCRYEAEKAQKAHYAVNIETLYHFLNRPVLRREYDEYTMAWQKERMKIIRSFGDGEIPSAWLEMYADCYRQMAHFETENHNYIEAIDYLTEYLDFTEKYLITIKDGDILSYGNKTIFGDLARKALYGNGDGCPHAMMSETVGDDGTRHFFWSFIFYPEGFIYDFKENRTFFPLRDNARFKFLVERAERIAEKWIKENE